MPTDGLYGGYVVTWAGITANRYQHALMKTSEENGQLLTRRVTNQLKREYKTDGRLYLVIRLIMEDSHSNAEPLHCKYQCFELQREILQLIHFKLENINKLLKL